MGILTRYLIRAHVGPFVFALTALTALIFLNAVAQRLELLAGKGLSWTVIAEFLVLSLPHTIALTLPMAILVAVLYTFSELTAGNEITAMSAGGIKPARLLVPLVGVGIIMGGVMFIFNDRILPESNHRLKGLMSDLVRKSPTFELREQVVNEIRNASGQTVYFLQASAIDTETNELTDVVIYDVSDARRYRTIYADHGTMAFSAGRTDLYLTLHDGVIHEVSNDEPGTFQRNFYETQVIQLKGVADELERQLGGGQRTDREMNISMLRDRVQAQHDQIAKLRTSGREQSLDAVRQALGLPEEEAPAEPLAKEGADEDTLMAEAPVVSTRPSRPSASTPSRAGRDPLTRQVAQQHQTSAQRARTLELNAYTYEVEIHKKWAIAFACIIFVLLGGPLAMRFPRGGVGMVIAMSLLIFGIYWMGLLGGERLADRGKANPMLAMWAANLLFMALAAWLLAGMGKAGSTTRGGGWEEVLFKFKRRMRRLRGHEQRRADAPAEARAGAGGG
ncbi:MAG: LptF/LptG family permease [Gemmatimonadota bacterium]